MEHDTNSIQVKLEFNLRLDGKDNAHVSEYKDKFDVILSFHRESVAAIPQAEPKPTLAHSSTAVATWTHALENLFSILFFTTRRFPDNVKHTSWARSGRIGSVTRKRRGIPWKRTTLTTRRRRGGRTTNSCTTPKYSSAMTPTIYSTPLTVIAGVWSQLVPDECYEGIFLQTLPAEYESVRTSSYERRDSHLEDIRRMMGAREIYCPPRPNNSPSVVGRGVPMQAILGDDNAINCTTAAIRNPARKTASLG